MTEGLINLLAAYLVAGGLKLEPWDERTPREIAECVLDVAGYYPDLPRAELSYGENYVTFCVQEY